MPKKLNKNQMISWLITFRKVMTHKTILTYVLPFLLFIVLHMPIERFLNVVLVNPVFSKVGSTILNNVVFWILAFYIFILFLSRIVNFVPSASAFGYQLLGSGIYLYYRSCQNVWILYPLYGNKNLYYTDIILEITVLNTLLLLRQLLKAKKLTHGKGFNDDSPVGKEKPDLLGYEPYVRLLNARISKTKADTAIAIGVNGRWGSGKTSFFDLLKRQMTDEPIIIIDFDPWNSFSPKAIIKDFFDTVQRAIRPYHSQLPKLLDTYTDKLISLHSEGWGKFTRELKSVIVPEQSLNDLYEKINSEIKAIDRKILIYIDDLDRLDKEEVAEVIRLIRNTANFSNTFFIVAYDRNYVLSAIKAMNAFNHSHFLEKIFQIEVNLPYFAPSIIQRKLADLLKAYYHEDYHQTIEDEIVGNGSRFPNYFEGWIETLRDVTRLSNGITLNLDNLLTEVVFSEFVRLEILRLKFPAVYEIFYRRHSLFLSTSDKLNGTNGYVLKLLGDNSGKDFGLTKEHAEFELYLRQNAEQLAVERHEIDHIVRLIDGIFGVSKLTARFVSHLSVVYPSRFELYFSYSVLEGKLSEAEFLSAIDGGIQQLKKKIDEWNNKKLNFEVLRRFLQVKTFNNRTQFETIIEGIFYFARRPDNNRQYGFEERQLANLLSDYKKNISNKFYGGKQNEYANFMRHLFAGAKSPYSFDSDFLEHLNKSYEDSFPISKGERLKLVLSMFKKYTEEFKEWDYNLWRLFHACSYKDWTPTGGNTFRGDTIYPDDCKTIMISAIERNLESFLPVIIDFPPFVDDHMYISKVVETIFGSYNAFGEFLHKMNTHSSKILDEFIQFYQELAVEKFQNAVPFKFKSIKIVKRGSTN